MPSEAEQWYSFIEEEGICDFKLVQMFGEVKVEGRLLHHRKQKHDCESSLSSGYGTVCQWRCGGGNMESGCCFTVRAR